MSKPIASFTFETTGLTVTFKDMSANAPTSWAWDFGFKDMTDTQVTSTLQNPDPVVFPANGIYTIILITSNAEGPSNPFVIPLIISADPRLNFTIRQMVLADLPGGFALDTLIFQQQIHKLQLYVQPYVNTDPPISDEDVFDESKYPSLVNVLISKLIVWELIVKAASSAMISFANASQAYNANIANVNTSTVLIADYSIAFDNTALFAGIKTVNTNLIIIDGISYGPSGALNESGLLTWLNNLNKGVFFYSGGTLQSLGNSHILTTFNYTGTDTSANGAFTLSNSRVVSISTGITVTSSGSVGGMAKGPLKKLETGPSNAEWYDGSAFWSTMMKGTGSLSSSAAGGGSGIIQVIQNEICLFSKRVSIPIPFCAPIRSTVMFIVAKKNNC